MFIQYMHILKIDSLIFLNLFDCITILSVCSSLGTHTHTHTHTPGI